jgi:hypothetical protein
VQWQTPGLGRTSLLYVDGHFVCLGEYGKLQLIRADPKAYQLVTEVDLSKVPVPGGAKATAEKGQEVRSGSGAATGEGKRLLSYPCWAAPVLSHGLLYVRGNDRLVCLELIPEGP